MNSETPPLPHNLPATVWPKQDGSVPLANNALERPFGDVGVFVMDGNEVKISAELYEVLLHDSQERGISLEQAYVEEMAARRELEKIMPSADVLSGMIERSGAPAYLATEAPGECPF